jgi:hypothetical protein
MSSGGGNEVCGVQSYMVSYVEGSIAESHAAR